MRKKSFMAAACAVTLCAATFTSCSDEAELEQSTTQVVVNPESNNVFKGSFRSVNASETSGKYLSLNIDDSMVKLSTKDASGSAEAQYTFSKDGKEINGQFQSDVDGIKSFNICKIGTFYYEMTAEMKDGSQQFFGFTRQTMLSRAGNNDDVSIQLIKYAAKKSMGMAFDLIPVVGSDLGEFVMGKIFDNDEGPKDMTVEECFNKLQQGQEKILNEIAENRTLIETVITNGYLDQLKAHEQFQQSQNGFNKRCLNKLASIQDSINKGVTPEVEASLRKDAAKAIKQWGADGNWNKAILFISDTQHGTGNFVHWSKLIDTFAENNFAWEHQGYEFRKAYRLRDMITCAENAMLVNMYQDVTKETVSFNRSTYEAVVKEYVDNMVKEDNNNAICQITGANHVKIARNSFRDMPTINLDYGGGYIGEDESWHSRWPQRIDLRFLFWKFPERNVELRKYNVGAVESMLSKGEAEAILKYYNNSKSMREILEQEALVKHQGTDSSSDLLFLSDSKFDASPRCGSDDYPYMFILCINDALHINSKGVDYGYYHFSHWNAAHELPRKLSFLNDHYMTSRICYADVTPVKSIVVMSRQSGWGPTKYSDNK